jgi:RND family efflux transporter MFP subunit
MEMKELARAFLTMGVVCLCAVGTACSRSRAATETGSELPTIAVSKATRGDIAQVLTISSEFRPYQEIDVHAKVAGYLKSISVDVGDRVQAGQLLAVLEIPELEDEQRQDEAAVKRAEDEINRSQADLERAEATHDVAHLGATRLASVIKERPNLVAQQDIDEASGRDRVSEAQVATGRAALAAAREQLEMAKANRGKTNTLFGYARISAPFAGVITRRYADTGAMIQAGTSSQTQAMPLVKLSENTLLRLTIPVPESAVNRIRLGATVDVDVPAIHKKFPGIVARFSDKVDEQTRTMETEVDVKNKDLELVPGMFASATLVLAQKPSALVVPIQAVDRTDTSAVLTVVSSAGRIEQRPVSLGIEAADRVEVTKGLQENELVVVGGRSQLRPGDRVQAKLVSAAPEGAK